MKKIIKPLALLLFTASYAALMSLAMSCFMQLPSIAFASSWVGESYPRLTFFCYAVPVIALLVLIGLLILNIKLSHRLGYTKDTWLVQSICAFAISLPMTQIWGELLDFLQKTF